MGEAAEQFEYQISEEIRAFALTFPEATEGTSCVNRAFKAGPKNFAFLGEKPDECGLRLKLGESVEAARERDEARPGTVDVGTGGWTMVKFAPDDPPAMDELRAWITESFLLLAPKKIAARYEK